MDAGAGTRFGLSPLVIVAGLLAGCGRSAGSVLERVDARPPPGSTLRMDVLLVRETNSCAVGPDCNLSDPNQCFFLLDASGARTLYAPDAVRFLRPSSPELAAAERPRCFRLLITDAQRGSVVAAIERLRDDVFGASGGDLSLDVRMHDLPSIETELVALNGGVLLPSGAATEFGLPLVSRDTDFAYVVTGSDDPEMGVAARLESCAGTTNPNRGLGGTSYSWVGISDSCLEPSLFLSTWIFQFYFGVNDVMGFDDLYGGGFPACGSADADTTRWVPFEADCTRDPDYVACGQARCPDLVAYYRHIISSHWQRGRRFEGNRCSNGKLDFDETGVDQGGACDQIRP